MKQFFTAGLAFCMAFMLSLGAIFLLPPLPAGATDSSVFSVRALKLENFTSAGDTPTVYPALYSKDGVLCFRTDESTVTTSADWASAGASALQWDGGSTNLVAATGRTSLGLVIGTNVQAYDAQLADVAGLTPTDNSFIVGNGTNFTAESAATALGSIGAQAADAQLTDVAAITPTADNFVVGNGTNLIAKTPTQARSSLGLGTMATQGSDAITVTGGSAGGLAYVGFYAEPSATNTPTIASGVALWLAPSNGNHTAGLYVVTPGKVIYPLSVGAGINPAS